MSAYVYSLELQHHGIKGMRWGIRRFQRKDGSLTPEGKKRYDDDGAMPKNKSSHRSKLVEKYRQNGMSQKEAEAAADKRIKTEKVIAITAGMTVAAATAYVVSKNVKERADGVIKAGTKLQVVADDPNKNLDRAFYTSFKDSDNAKYKGMLGRQINLRGADAHKITLDTNKDVKIASRKKAVDTFKDLYKNDPEFKDAFHKSADQMRVAGVGENRAKIFKTASMHMNDKQLKKAGYDVFNIGLVNHTPEGNTAAKKFYDRMKAQGYDAIMDINDQKYSGYNSKKPVIIFNKGDKVSVSEAKKLTYDQVMSNLNKVQTQMENEKKMKDLAKQGAAYVGVWGGLFAVGAYASSQQTKTNTNKKKKG